ncbi:hypothetical protein C8Q79DRAFT_744272 [Trametes meyenii]|nr:hypothetical protein C8Q79DRAFT_744272 [Trametes meyenii]
MVPRTPPPGQRLLHEATDYMHPRSPRISSQILKMKSPGSRRVLIASAEDVRRPAAHKRASAHSPGSLQIFYVPKLGRQPEPRRVCPISISRRRVDLYAPLKSARDRSVLRTCPARSSGSVSRPSSAAAGCARRAACALVIERINLSSTPTAVPTKTSLGPSQDPQRTDACPQGPPRAAQCKVDRDGGRAGRRTISAHQDSVHLAAGAPPSGFFRQPAERAAGWKVEPVGERPGRRTISGRWTTSRRVSPPP